MNKRMAGTLAMMTVLASMGGLPPVRPEPHKLRVMVPPRNEEEAIRKAEQKREMRKQKRLTHAQKVKPR